MITRAEFEEAQQLAAALLAKTGLSLRPAELTRIDVADFGLGELATSGGQFDP